MPPTPSLSAQVDAVLRKHAVGINTLAWPLGKSMTQTQAWQELIDDLCALLTPVAPSREELEKSLCEETSIPFSPKDSSYNCPATWVLNPKRLIDFIMAWATRPASRPVWCEHLTFDPSMAGGWGIKTENPSGMHYAPNLDHWTYCPLCGAARPA